ncbi:MAG TPA: metalloregulator ArsR/SmtB family transcription factor [Vicinamibacterales bacterium]|nr:metalloregulator ArsR/SmtB family transcription factor [Vicinamibacterales bacterium]
MDNSLTRLDGVFLALSDATRRAVLARLCHGPATVSDLAQPFDMALPSFLKHVRVLEGSGWIATRKQGRVRTCSLRPNTLEVSQRWLLTQQHVWEARTDRLEQFVTGESQRGHRASRRGARK